MNELSLPPRHEPLYVWMNIHFPYNGHSLTQSFLSGSFSCYNIPELGDVYNEIVSCNTKLITRVSSRVNFNQIWFILSIVNRFLYFLESRMNWGKISSGPWKPPWRVNFFSFCEKVHKHAKDWEVSWLIMAVKVSKSIFELLPFTQQTSTLCFTVFFPFFFLEIDGKTIPSCSCIE